MTDIVRIILMILRRANPSKDEINTKINEQSIPKVTQENNKDTQDYSKDPIIKSILKLTHDYSRRNPEPLQVLHNIYHPFTLTQLLERLEIIS